MTMQSKYATEFVHGTATYKLCYTLSFPTFHNSQAKPSLWDLLQLVKVTNWFDLGSELQIDSYPLEVIQADQKQ